jgi:hypothetical protein
MMKYWGKGKAFVGIAGILPAAAGMLPGPLSRAVALQFAIRFHSEFKLSGRMPDRAGNMPALPCNIHDSQCNDVTVHEIHAHRAHI